MIVLENAGGSVKNELGLSISTANAALAVIERSDTSIGTTVGSHLEGTFMSLQSSR
jgi:hypothetical protein